MKINRTFLMCVVGAAVLGSTSCSNYVSEDAAITAGAENKEPPTFGSATDIIPENGTNVANIADSADIGIGGPVQERSGNYEDQPMLGQKSDEELEKQIRVAITTGSLGTTGAIPEDSLTSLGVHVNGGIVTLTGTVPSQEERTTIGTRVSGFKGVRSVRNELSVGLSQARP